MRFKLKYLALFTLLLVSVTVMPACTAPRSQTGPSSLDNEDVDLTPTTQPEETENPKLDSSLNQLIEAYQRGEVESFKQQVRVQLEDNSVWVTIECLPDQFNAATGAVRDIGGRLGSVSASGNLFDALVPIASLTGLAEEESIIFIENPIKPPVVHNLPPSPPPDKGNPKLDTFLNGLIKAEEHGEAESYARQSDVELVDGNVKVTIEAKLGQLDAAVKAASAVGNVELISSDINWVQAVVPINSLTDLAKEESIRLIRNPIRLSTGG
jgi:hypothetical protein